MRYAAKWLTGVKKGRVAVAREPIFRQHKEHRPNLRMTSNAKQTIIQILNYTDSFENIWPGSELRSIYLIRHLK
jgi:hypothetical protein